MTSKKQILPFQDTGRAPGAPSFLPQPVGRRTFFKGAVLGLATLAAGDVMPAAAGAEPAPESAQTASPIFAYVGCFTTKERNARGKGISVYRIDPATSAWNLVQVLDTIANPQFISFDRQQRFLYSAHGDGTEIGAYAIDKKTGRVEFLNKQPSGATNAPHLIPDPTNRYMVLANGTGLAVFPINKDGSLAPASDTVVPSGEPGPNRRGQAGPHPHHVAFDMSGRFIASPDRNLDKVHVYRLVPGGKLVANDPPSVATRPGAGPRHLAFHPTKPFAYVVNETDSTVTAYNWDSERGQLKPFQVIPTAPAAYTANNSGSEIAVAPSGNFVYASNRGHNSIVTFAVGQTTGMLNPVGWEATRGKNPRFFTLDASGDLVYVGNLDSDSIDVFRVDPKTGTLAPTGQSVETGSPSCIVFARS